jgi:serine/threonine protein kinase
LQFLQHSFKCLIAALEVIHANTTKHMDIKPLNILVKQLGRKERKDWDFSHYRVYIADFGISRNFSTQDHSQTDSPTPRSPLYCAPEVFNRDPRGRAADVFSMGCVFLEMATVLCGLRCEDFSEFRETGNGDGDESFRMNLNRVETWSNEKLSQHPAPHGSVLRRTYDGNLREWLPAFLSMVCENPDMRPTAAALKGDFGTWSCCKRGPEPFESEAN